MSLIFISHSGRDNAKAAEMKSWLAHADRGHTSVFLDFDPADGIPAGRDWEKELYARLRSCRAVIVLCSEHSMASEWCFAEITHARALGKAVFPVQIGRCTLKPILTRDQVVDLTVNEAEGYQRLWNGLLKAGLDPRTLFHWDASRPPYPGLMALQEQDAAIYYGREKEIQQTIELLNRMPRLQSSRLAVILGASGSGKSSLMRAGVLPRLKNNSKDWIVVGPFQPRSHPIDELARAFEHAFGSARKKRSWRTIRDQLDRARRSGDAAPVFDLAYGLQSAAKCPDAVVLIALDQAEELWGQASAATTDEFLELLRLVLETADSPFLALATLRSDYLAQCQSSVAQHRIRFDPYPLAPMAIEDLPQIIEKPAELAGLALEPGLVHAMTVDTKRSDALSLLAFTLRELWEIRGREGLLTLDMYRTQLGGLTGALQRAAEHVVAACGASDETKQVLRRAFVSLVRIDDDGRFVRRPVRWDSLPDGAREFLQRFVAARLLVSSEVDGAPIVEVVHEDLFRVWDRLDSWLKDDRLFLVGRRRLRTALTEWQRLRRDDAALLRGGVLSEAESWLAGHETELDSSEREFIEASTALREATKAEERRQLEEERRLRQTAEEQRRYAESREFAARALLSMEDDPAEALAHAVHAGRSAPTREAEVVLRKTIEASHARAIFRHDAPVNDAIFSPDGRVIVTAGADGIVGIWERETGRLVHRLRGHQDDRYHREVFRVAFSPEGKMVASAGKGGIVRLWDVESGAELDRFDRHTGSIMHIGFNREGTHLLSTSADCTVRVWDMKRHEEYKRFSGHMGTAWHAAFSPDGRLIVATAGDSFTSFIWDIATEENVTSLSTGGRVVWNTFTPDGKRIVTASLKTGARIWNVESLPEVPEPISLPGHVGDVHHAAFLSDIKLITSGEDATARIWLHEKGPPESWREIAVLRGHRKPVLHAAFDTLKAVTASDDGTAWVWEETPSTIMRAESWTALVVLRGHRGSIGRACFSPDGRVVLTASKDGTARLWTAEPGHEVALIRQRGQYQTKHVAFSDDAKAVAVTTSGFFHDETDVLEVETQKPIARLKRKEAGWLNTGPAPRSVVFSPDRRKLVALYYTDNIAKVWDAEAGTELAVLSGHEDDVRSARFTRDSAWVMTTSDDNTIRIWEVESGRQVALLKMPGERSGEVTINDAKNRVLTIGRDWVLQVWTAPLWRRRAVPLKGLDTTLVSCAAVSPDAQTVVTGSTDGAARLWDAESGAERVYLSGHTAAVTHIGFDAEGQKIVTVAVDGTARVWDAVPAGNSIVLTGDSSVTGAALSPDGFNVLTCCKDGAIRVWDTRDATLLAVLPGGAGDVRVADFSLDGKKLVTICNDQTIRVFLVRQADLLELAESRLAKAFHVGQPSSLPPIEARGQSCT
jgi:WD40 repeat protein